jgi:hypothetical protein
MGARNRVGIGLLYRPARLHRLAELIPGNPGLLKSLKIRALECLLCRICKNCYGTGCPEAHCFSPEFNRLGPLSLERQVFCHDEILGLPTQPAKFGTNMAAVETLIQ